MVTNCYLHIIHTDNRGVVNIFSIFFSLFISWFVGALPSDFFLLNVDGKGLPYELWDGGNGLAGGLRVGVAVIQIEILACVGKCSCHFSLIMVLKTSRCPVVVALEFFFWRKGNC